MPLDQPPATPVTPPKTFSAVPPPAQSAPAVEFSESVRKQGAVGPTVGIVVIVILLLLGALYFWGEQLNMKSKNPPPYIPGDTVSQ